MAACGPAVASSSVQAVTTAESTGLSDPSDSIETSDDVVQALTGRCQSPRVLAASGPLWRERQRQRSGGSAGGSLGSPSPHPGHTGPALPGPCKALQPRGPPRAPQHRADSGRAMQNPEPPVPLPRLLLQTVVRRDRPAPPVSFPGGPCFRPRRKALCHTSLRNRTMRLVSKEGFLVLFQAPSIFKPTLVRECTVWAGHSRGWGSGSGPGCGSGVTGRPGRLSGHRPPAPSCVKALVLWFWHSWQAVLLGLCMLFPRLLCGNRRVRGDPLPAVPGRAALPPRSG